MTWESEYLKKIRTADAAMAFVESGMRVYIQPGCAEPETLVEALMRRGPAVRDVEIVHMMTLGSADYTRPVPLPASTTISPGWMKCSPSP